MCNLHSLNRRYALKCLIEFKNTVGQPININEVETSYQQMKSSPDDRKIKDLELILTEIFLSVPET